jgi:putative aldouronate transport system permease protein
MNGATDFRVVRKQSFLQKLFRQKQLMLMSLPFVAVLIVFNYLPLWGWIMAFQHYSVAKGIFGSSFAGLDNFRELFSDPQFYLVLRNTLAMSLLNLVFGFTGAITLALLLNEVKSTIIKRTIQTITYIPHFVSWVVIANIVMMSLSPDGGVVNVLLLKLGWIHEPIYFMSKDKWFWLIHTAASVWKELGWNTIIYLAVLAGINPEQYEAAEVDGANRFHRMWHVSIPFMMPTAIILLILSLGYLMQSGYESQFLLGSPMVKNVSDVLDLYALDYSISLGDYSLGVTIGIFKSVISVGLVLAVNILSKKLGNSRVL